jgi:hypothetical protein
VRGNMLVNELKESLEQDNTLPVYIQVGHNRFPIECVHNCSDYMLIGVALDADNPDYETL